MHKNGHIGKYQFLTFHPEDDLDDVYHVPMPQHLVVSLHHIQHGVNLSVCEGLVCLIPAGVYI